MKCLKISVNSFRQDKIIIIYKYVEIPRIDVLQNSQICFSQAVDLNDPFEILPNKEQYVTNLAFELQNNPIYDSYGKISEADALKKAIFEVDRRYDEYRSSFLILSLTTKRNNLVMWSHYTNKHKGFVMGFNSDHPFFKYPSGFESRLLKVEYSDNRPSFFDFSRTQLNQAARHKWIITTKSEDWRYEKEFRVIETPDNASRQLDIGGHIFYLFEFPPDLLQEVIFGALINPDDRQKITEVVTAKYPQAQLYQANYSSANFDLDIEPYVAP